MAEKDWATLYTDEQYLSKSELQAVMKTSLIDGYWNDILAYRKKHETEYPFFTIPNKPIYLTATDAISARIEAAELKIARFLNLYKSLRDAHEIELARRAIYLESLRAISVLEGASMSELSLKALLNGTYGESNPLHAPVIAFRKALDFYSDKVVVGPTEDFLGDAYARLLGVEELTKFYRVRDFDAYAARAKFMYNPDYTYAPSEAIESLMQGLMGWLEKSDAAHFVKALAALYYLDYLKPFDDHNESLAALLAKDAYASSEQGDEAFLLPFEAVLASGSGYKALALETSRTGDLTYLVIHAIEVLMPLLDSLTEEINSVRVATYVPEYTALTGDEKALADLQNAKKSQQLSLFDTATIPGPILAQAVPVTAAPTTVAVPVMATPTVVTPIVPSPAVLKPAPVVPTPGPMAPSQSAPQAVSQPVVAASKAPSAASADKAPVAAPKKVREAPLAAPTIAEPGTLAHDGPTLSEKEVREYVLYLLETNPHLNKNQAAFLASHCTPGRYYTIQQFKQTIKCAYETARTSMDKLAAEGYYEKLQVKNKFVYSPAPKGEKK
jgi:Fic family protein